MLYNWSFTLHCMLFICVLSVFQYHLFLCTLIYIFGSTFLHPFCPVMKLSTSLMRGGHNSAMVLEPVLSSRFFPIAPCVDTSCL